MHHSEFRRALSQHRSLRGPLRRPIAAASLLTLLATASPAAQAAQAAPNPLSGGLHGQSRVLIVFAPSDTDPLLREQRSALHPGSPASAERDLAVVEVIGDAAANPQIDGRALRASYRVPRDVFTVILIGKDGGEKLRKLRPLSEAALFATIDRMPMRREEAAQQKAQP